MKEELPFKENFDEDAQDPSNGKEEIPCEETDEEAQDAKVRTNLFRLISIGNATGQSFLFNFFSAFAVQAGIQTEALGFMTSIRNLMSSIFQGTIGRLSDKIGRRYILLVGFFLGFSTMIVLVFLHQPYMLIIVSVIQAFSLSLIIPVWNATLGDVTKIRERASYMGKLSALGTAVSVSSMLVLATIFEVTKDKVDWGFSIGNLVFTEWEMQYGVAFLVAAFNFLLCIVGVFFLKETRANQGKKVQPKIWIALKDKTFTKYFIINSVFGLIMSTMWPIFPIAQIVILEMNFFEIAIINATFTICFSLAQYLGGRLGDSIGRKPLIIFGRVSMFTIPIVMIGAIFMGDWRMLLLSNIIGGTAMGAVTVAHNAYLLDIAPSDQMGAYSGLNQLGWGVMTFIGSLSFGFIAAKVETNVGTIKMIIILFSIIAVIRFLASMGFFFMDESLPKERRLEILQETKDESTVVYSCIDDQSQTK